MKIKKMKIKYTFAPTINRKQYSFNQCDNFISANSNNNYKKKRHLKPLINLPEKNILLNSKSTSFFLPQILSNGNQCKQTDQSHNKKAINSIMNESHFQPHQHLSEQRFLDSEFNRLNEVFRKKLKGTKKTMMKKSKYFIFNPKTLENNDSEKENFRNKLKLNRERAKSQPTTITKNGRNKKSFIDGCTQTCKRDAIFLKKSKSRVVDLSLFVLNKIEMGRVKIVNS